MALPQIRQDWNSYWSQDQPGPMDWAGGTLTRRPSGAAMYEGPGGVSKVFNQNTPLSSLYQVDPIRDYWNSQYGSGTMQDMFGGGTGGGGAATSAGTNPWQPAGPSPGGPANEMQSDWNAFWNQGQPGQTYDWAQGQLNMGPNARSATYIDPTGQEIFMKPGDDLSRLYQNPYIQQTWNQDYGQDYLTNLFGGGGGGGQPSTNPGGINDQGPSIGGQGPNVNFDPISDIRGYYDDAAGMVGDAYSGLYENIPQYNENALGLINQAYDRAQGYLPQMFQQRLQPALQQGVNNLAGRNMINSSVGSDLLAKTAQGVNRDILGLQGQLGARRAGAISDFAGRRYDTMTGLEGRQGDVLSNLAGQYAQQAGGLHGREYELLASILPTLINYQRS